MPESSVRPGWHGAGLRRSGGGPRWTASELRILLPRFGDQLGNAKVSMIQDRYLDRRLTDRITGDVLEGLFDDGGDQNVSLS